MLPQTNENNGYISIPPVCTHAPFFVNENSSHPSDFNDYIALLYSSCDHCIQPEDGETRRGRNMQLAETFVYTLIPCTFFVNENSSHPSDFNDYIALFYSSCDHCIQPEDGLTRRGRNMQLAETFVYTLIPCILQNEVVFLIAISIRISLPTSKIHDGVDTPKDL